MQAESTERATSDRRRPGRARTIAFAVTAVVFLVMHLILSPLPYAVLGWFLEGGAVSHRVHEICFGLLFVLTAVGLLSLLRSPERKTAAMYQVVIPLYLIILSVLLIDRLVDPIVFAFIIFPIILIVLYPDRRSLFRPVTSPSGLLLGAVAIAAVPLLIYAVAQIQEGVQASKLAPQVLEDLPDSATDKEIEEALAAAARTSAELEAVQHFGHWSAMGAFAIAIGGLGIVAAVRMPAWRLTAWAAGIAAAVLGAASLASAGDASALSGPWGIAAILWGAGFVAAAEYVNRTSPAFHHSVEGPRKAA